MAGKAWTQEELDLVIQLGPTIDCAEIAKRLGRTTRAVRHAFNQLGLEKERAKVGDTINGWKIESINEVEKYGQKISMADIISTLDNSTRKSVKLTILSKGKIGWPDRRRPDVSEKNKKHGLSKHPLYSTYKGMIARCIYPSHISYETYGGRGITVCDEWLNSFQSFYDWAISNGWEEGLTLDREKSNNNYEPSNCRWVTQKDNNNNRSVSINITAFGETKNLADWALDARCNCSYWSLMYRIKQGWEPEKSITTPSRKSKSKFKRYKEFYRWCKENHPEVAEEFLNQ